MVSNNEVEVTVAPKIVSPEWTVMPIRSKALSLTWGMLIWLFPATLYGGVPTDQVRATADQVLEILKDPQFASAATKPAQRDRLRDAIYPRFDFEDMSRRSLGPTWRKISKTEQDEFVQLFKHLLEGSYINNIQGYKGEKIVYTNETQEQDSAHVDTKLIPQEGEPSTINYHLHKVGEEWKVYDVVIDNISIVNNYRAVCPTTGEKLFSGDARSTAREGRCGAMITMVLARRHHVN
jgi:phospholipid transport system substrate-binding protein